MRVKNVCQAQSSRIKRAYGKFPPEVRDFGEAFCKFQKLRHGADYDPLFEPLTTHEVMAHIDEAEAVLSRYSTAHKADRRAFAVFVSFDLRS